MARMSVKKAASQPFIPLVEQLSAAYQAFSLYDAEGLRKSGSGLTPSQARVIFALGGTDGMTCKDIGDITLITKGTLTGVVDRLEEKGLVERWSVEGDGRNWLLIDDLVDTGNTARVVRDILPRAHFATVYAKPAGRPVVDTFITEVSQDTWILFPWDAESQFVQPMAGQGR